MDRGESEDMSTYNIYVFYFKNKSISLGEKEMLPQKYVYKINSALNNNECKIYSAFIGLTS